MKCEKCGAEDCDVFVILPLHHADGRLDTIVCVACAEKSSAWCPKHGRVHQGFMDGTTACLACVKEVVDAEAITDGGWRIYHETLAALEGEEAEVLEDALQMSAVIMRDNKALALLRFAASRALRTGTETMEIVRQAMDNRSAVHLLR